jgi:hypothetical protein
VGIARRAAPRSSCSPRHARLATLAKLGVARHFRNVGRRMRPGHDEREDFFYGEDLMCVFDE